MRSDVLVRSVEHDAEPRHDTLDGYSLSFTLTLLIRSIDAVAEHLHRVPLPDSIAAGMIRASFVRFQSYSMPTPRTGVRALFVALTASSL